MKTKRQASKRTTGTDVDDGPEVDVIYFLGYFRED